MKLIIRGTKLYSIIFNKCPKCHVGSFWDSNNPFKNMIDSRKNSSSSCVKCKLIFEIEPGFWYGAMYISYIIGVGAMIVLWSLIASTMPQINVLNEILILVIAIVLISPINYHVSRLVWINLFIKYRANKEI